ncbi:MAG: DUF4013 domain-containing protein [Natrialbaceae archaeon]|nr:DUF4013 domain-containing protein [Natrialbaceae archaeon]
MGYCPECETVVAPEWSTCPDCGTEVLELSVRPTDETTPTMARGERGGRDDRLLVPFALQFPLTDGLQPLVITAALVLLSPLVLPVVMLVGYGMRIARTAARGEAGLPSPHPWGQTLTDGGLFLVAMVPLFIIGGLVTLVSLIVLLLGGENPVVLGIVGIVAFGFSYLGGAVVPTIIATGSVVATYKDRQFLTVAQTMTYLKGFITQMVCSVVALGLILGLTAVLAGSLVGLPILFALTLAIAAYVIPVSWTIWGAIARDAANVGLLPPVDADSSLELTF